MTSTVRKQIYIAPEQESILKQLAKETGISEAEIIRQAIDRHTQPVRSPQRNLSAWEHEQRFIQQLIDQGPIPGHRTWQREDLYEQ